MRSLTNDKDEHMEETALHLQPAWEQLLQACGIARPMAQARFPTLVETYNSPGRVYHTLSHIQSVLAWIERLSASAVDLPAIQLAAWFHDCIYDPRASDNEEQSALFMERFFSDLSLPDGMLQAASAMILSTKTHRVAEDQTDCQILLDADLAILGVPFEAYEAYARAIREEYAWVPTDAYRTGRVQVLQAFLQRGRIYWTDYAFTVLEEQACANIRREIIFLA
jgi:predicted metal-dependent HD superfamily phosphohydrolase